MALHLLFTLYVNELLSVPKNYQTMEYVYDTKILLSLSPCNVSEAVVALNSDLKEVSRWYCANSLLIILIKPTYYNRLSQYVFLIFSPIFVHNYSHFL